MSSKRSSRNLAVEVAVNRIIETIDSVLAGSVGNLPVPRLRAAIDAQLQRRASIRVASIFLLSYSICEPEWDCEHIPIGARGTYGDKRLSSELTSRNLSLNDNITAFGENLGWKGNVLQARLSTDDRFTNFTQVVGSCSIVEREAGLVYFANKFAESRRILQPLPPLPQDLLTFARARVLFWDLLAIPSEGHIQQFVVAGLLRVHRRRFGHTVKTHHPHASDTFDGTAGDIEEFRNTELVAAYEVTVRSDWKNRLHDFRLKMSSYGLSKYWIVASNVYGDVTLADPRCMLEFLGSAEADLSVVDIKAFVDVFLAELNNTEVRTVVNEVFADLTNPALSNRHAFIDAYTAVIGGWLDTVSS